MSWPSRCSKQRNDSPSKVSWRLVPEVSAALLTRTQFVLHHPEFAGGDRQAGCSMNPADPGQIPVLLRVLQLPEQCKGHGGGLAMPPHSLTLAGWSTWHCQLTALWHSSAHCNAGKGQIGPQHPAPFYPRRSGGGT